MGCGRPGCSPDQINRSIIIHGILQTFRWILSTPRLQVEYGGDDSITLNVGTMRRVCVRRSRDTFRAMANHPALLSLHTIVLPPQAFPSDSWPPDFMCIPEPCEWFPSSIHSFPKPNMLPPCLPPPLSPPKGRCSIRW